MKNVRKLKVVKKFQNRSFSKVVSVPAINLAGKWLKDSGFENGQSIKIIVENQKLIIVPE